MTIFLGQYTSLFKYICICAIFGYSKNYLTLIMLSLLLRVYLYVLKKSLYFIIILSNTQLTEKPNTHFIIKSIKEPEWIILLSSMPISPLLTCYFTFFIKQNNLFFCKQLNLHSATNFNFLTCSLHTVYKVLFLIMSVD